MVVRATQSSQAATTNLSPKPLTVTQQEFRRLLSSVSDILDAMSDGRIVLDGHPLTDAPIEPRIPMSISVERRPTIKELRAQAQAEERAVPQIPIPNRKAARKRSLPARRVYALKTPKDSNRLDLEGLTESEVSVVKLLAVSNKPTMKDIYTSLKLQRSTVANIMTKLRKRDLIESAPA